MRSRGYSARLCKNFPLGPSSPVRKSGKNCKMAAHRGPTSVKRTTLPGDSSFCLCLCSAMQTMGRQASGFAPLHASHVRSA